MHQLSTNEKTDLSPVEKVENKVSGNLPARRDLKWCIFWPSRHPTGVLYGPLSDYLRLAVMAYYTQWLIYLDLDYLRTAFVDFVVVSLLLPRLFLHPASRFVPFTGDKGDEKFMNGTFSDLQRSIGSAARNWFVLIRGRSRSLGWHQPWKGRNYRQRSIRSRAGVITTFETSRGWSFSVQSR